MIANEETLLVVCDAVLFEVPRGVGHEARAARAERDLRRFRVEPVSAGPDDAAWAAARWRAMRAKGSAAGQADTQIAGWCLDRGRQLLHDDGAFDRTGGRACRSSGPERQGSGATAAALTAETPPSSPTFPSRLSTSRGACPKATKLLVTRSRPQRWANPTMTASAPDAQGRQAHGQALAGRHGPGHARRRVERAHAALGLDALDAGQGTP